MNQGLFARATDHVSDSCPKFVDNIDNEIAGTLEYVKEGIDVVGETQDDLNVVGHHLASLAMQGLKYCHLMMTRLTNVHLGYIV